MVDFLISHVKFPKKLNGNKSMSTVCIERYACEYHNAHRGLEFLLWIYIKIFKLPLEISDYDEMRNEASQYETLNTTFYVVQTPTLALSSCSLEVSKACAAYVMVRLTKGDHDVKLWISGIYYTTNTYK